MEEKVVQPLDVYLDVYRAPIKKNGMVLVGNEARQIQNKEKNFPVPLIVGSLQFFSTSKQLPFSRPGSRFRSNMDAGVKQMDSSPSSIFSKPCSTYSDYNIQSQEPFTLHHNYGPSPPNYSNYDDSSIFYTPWSYYTDEMKPTVSTRVKTKVQSERNKYGSEADLCGLVSNIIDESDKAQSFLDGGLGSSVLKSAWPCNINRIYDHQDLFLDFQQSEEAIGLQQSLYGTGQGLSTETENVEDLYEVNDLEQGEHWLYQCQTDNPYSSNINAKINPHWYTDPKNFLSETPKDFFQKRDTLLSPLYKYNFEEDLGRYDMNNHGKTMYNKHTLTGFPDVKSCVNLSSVLPAFDTDTYTNLFSAKQNCQPFDDFMSDQSFTTPKTTPVLSDRSFLKDSTYVPDYAHKPDFGTKTLFGNNMAFSEHFQKRTPKQELQNSDLKPSSFMSTMSSNNFEKLSWTNSHVERSYQKKNNKSSISLSTSQKNTAVVSNYSQACYPLLPGGRAQTFNSESFTSSSLDCGYNSPDKALEGFDRTTEEHKLESVAEKNTKTLNGMYENLSSFYSSLDRNVKKTIPEKRPNMSFSVQDKSLECMVQNYKELCNSALGYRNLTNASVDNKSLNTSKVIHPQNSPNRLVMGDMSSNFCVTSNSNYRSPFNNLGHNIHPMIDSHDAYSYENQSHIWPQISELLHGHTSLQSLAAMLSTQRSVKPRNMPANELHLCLDECYDQCKALEKERKKTESLLMKYYPGKKLSSTGNASIPRLTANPSRVDRLIVDQLREQARVATLLGKMERFRSSPLHANISTALDFYLESIHNVQTQRKNEIINASNHYQNYGRPHHNDDRDVSILASAIREMAKATCKARTVLWCALQMTLPKSSPAQSTGEVERTLQAIGKLRNQN
ncbi:meiosis-specific coiled-coil domain-containing protein MEIOC [Leptodactylus fuscus]|uniref:meiosis-specific coiled-coil domain-containing protein MEIOC n=1 Tax=Leptodactylus fuscus TaxID=238119 RepID=UPI003F4F0777